MEAVITLTKKQQKRLEKQQKKNQKNDLVERHTKVCLVMLEECYDEILKEIDEFNSELVDMSFKLNQKSLELEKYISLEDNEKIKENINETMAMADNYFKRIAAYITPCSKPDSIIAPLLKASKSVSSYLNNLELTLKIVRNKNATYITSTIYNVIQRKSQEYTNLVCDDFYENNEYFKAFEDTYYDYEDIAKAYKRQLRENNNELDSDIVIHDVPKETCGRGRLRVTHADMIDFAKYMGFEEDRQGNSTHRVFKHPETGISVPIPAKKGKDMPQGTTSMLLKQMGYKRMDLARFIER